MQRNRFGREQMFAAAGDLGLAALVVLLALLIDSYSTTAGSGLLPVVVAAAAAGLARTHSLVALALIWFAAAMQVVVDGAVLSTGFAIVVVGYRCGRYAGRFTAWCAGLSVPVGASAALILALRYPERVVSSVTSLFGLSSFGAAGGFVIVAAVLGAPFAVGLAVRTNERYRVSRGRQRVAESQAAAEHDIAQERAKQTQLARDVHDVVGHSLAVIIAQADSARLAATDDATRQTLEQIATVGRSSLAEVRDVLQRTDDAPVMAQQAEPGLDELIDGVRRAGHDVHDVVTGTPQPLPDAAYRVLQELLTNALKHGSGGTIEVEREWTDRGLVLRVGNPVTSGMTPPVDGMGLTGVRGRVDAAGGSFRAVLTGGSTERARVIATAYLPVP